MTDTIARPALLAALGLVDWQARPSAALDPARQAEKASTAPTSGVVEEADGAAAERASVAQIPAEMLATGAKAETRTDSSVAEQAPDQTIEDATPAEPSAADAAPNPSTTASIDETPVDSSADSPAGLDWAELEAWLAGQDHRGASRPVFGIGARDADVLIVGEAPGANEDAQGVPFVGRAGKLLDRMLAAIDCSRDTNVYITNICKFRPPDNRDPTAEEVAADWPVLERQIDLMQPKLVVAVGRIAAQTLLDCKTPLGKLRGTLHRYPHRDLDVLVTYHPAYLLRSPGQKAKAWVDLKQIAHRIGQLDAPAS